MAKETLDAEEAVPVSVRDKHDTALDQRVSLKQRFQAFKRQYPPLYPVVQTSVYLLILFLAIQSYFYGSLYRTTWRASSLRVLAVDYDQSIVGEAVRAGYEQLQGPAFLTLDFQPTGSFDSLDNLEDNICGDRYWGVLYTTAGASQRLQAAIAGNSSARYDPAAAMTFVYSGARWPVISEAYLLADMAQLTAAATQVLHAREGGNWIQSVNRESSSALQALYMPTAMRREGRTPIPQGAVILLNSFTLIIPPLMQFFFVMALDHISLATHTFARARPLKLYIQRLLGSALFSFTGGLTVTGCIWAFRESWDVSGAQYAETWMILWFYMAISYVVMDAFIGTVVPMRYAPFFIFSFVIVNVTSTLYPFELSPGFYRAGYAAPAHEVWWLLMQAWSRGCVAKPDVALPVLFGWWVAGHIGSALAVWRKCATARKVAAGV